MTLRRLLALGLAASIGLGSAHAQLPPQPARPDALMNAVTSEVIAVLKRDIAAGHATDVAQLVDNMIVPLFDFRRMTRTAVARGWQLASPEQQNALVAEFSRLLVRTYSRSLASFNDQEIEYAPLHAEDSDSEVLVRSLVRRSGAAPMSIDYDMANTPAGWKVYDVKVAGVSLVITYRETFAATLRAGGIDGLVKALTDKNRQNDSRPKDTDQQTRLAPEALP